jgi:hypothetical protein
VSSREGIRQHDQSANALSECGFQSVLDTLRTARDQERPGSACRQELRGISNASPWRLHGALFGSIRQCPVRRWSGS